MRVDEVRVISTSRDGLRREVVAIGSGGGNIINLPQGAFLHPRRRKKHLTRLVSKTIHQVRTSEGWVPTL